jgi:hypothetical protein
LQHTQHGPGVIVGVRYATYLISFIHHGHKEIDKNDGKLEEIIPENVTGRNRNTFGRGKIVVEDPADVGRHQRGSAAGRPLAKREPFFYSRQIKP